jgi:hypothetical protein
MSKQPFAWGTDWQPPSVSEATSGACVQKMTRLPSGETRVRSAYGFRSGVAGAGVGVVRARRLSFGPVETNRVMFPVRSYMSVHRADRLALVRLAAAIGVLGHERLLGGVKKTRVSITERLLPCMSWHRGSSHLNGSQVSNEAVAAERSVEISSV